MTDSPHTLRARRRWIDTFHQTNHHGITCLRCGISRPTLRKWLRRFQALGDEGLRSHSRRPHRFAPSKRSGALVEQILMLRRTRNLGSKRLQAELLRTLGIRLSTSTIHRVLRDAEVPPLRRPKRPRHPKRYSRPVAGDRVQIDTMKVADGLIQFTAIDDCTRLRVLALYPDKTGASAAHFFEHHLLPGFPFPIQRVQSDRGAEFISHEFLAMLRRHHVKLRPNRARAPHLNGKVERSQQTDLVEFYAQEMTGRGRHRRAKALEQLRGRLSSWQRFYNEERPHSGIGGRTPLARWEEVRGLTPSREQVWSQYDGMQEATRVRQGNWRWVQKPPRKAPK